MQSMTGPWGLAGACDLGFFFGTPKGTRTPVSAVRGRRPGPLDDGGPGRERADSMGPGGDSRAPRTRGEPARPLRARSGQNARPLLPAPLPRRITRPTQGCRRDHRDGPLDPLDNPSDRRAAGAFRLLLGVRDGADGDEPGHDAPARRPGKARRAYGARSDRGLRAADRLDPARQQPREHFGRVAGDLALHGGARRPGRRLRDAGHDLSGPDLLRGGAEDLCDHLSRPRGDPRRFADPHRRPAARAGGRLHPADRSGGLRHHRRQGRPSTPRSWRRRT